MKKNRLFEGEIPGEMEGRREKVDIVGVEGVDTEDKELEFDEGDGGMCGDDGVIVVSSKL